MAEKRTKSGKSKTIGIKGIEKMPTGIKGFDSVLMGGIPRGRTVLISGTTGTGKTVFTTEFLYQGITQFKENGVYVTFEERPADIVRNLLGFGWDFQTLIDENKLTFVDVSPDGFQEITGDYDLSALIERIKFAVKKVKAKRVSIDSLSCLFSRFTNKDVVRDMIYIICDELKNMGVTSIITAEKSDYETNTLSRFGVEEYVVDGVVELAFDNGQQQFVRKLFVRKLRGTNYRSGIVEYEITEKGLEVFPKIEVSRWVSKTDFDKKEAFGVKGLDETIGGGIPQGHGVLLSGNTGTGKTLLNIHFVSEGIKKGDKALYVALEEPVDQVKKTARSFGFDFDKYEKEGKLLFISTSLIDISVDKLLSDIVEVVNKADVKRVVFDSISSLQSATMLAEDVRQFLIQATGFFKMKGIASIINYLSSFSFGAEKGQLLAGSSSNLLRLSSVLDGILVLLYVERDQEIKRLFYVLKMRGSNHSRNIYEYEINDKGINFGKKFKA